jgi:hypothetical protein
MSAPLSTAVERGWIINEPGDDGIIEYLDPLDIEISYPKDMYEQYNTETDSRYLFLSLVLPAFILRAIPFRLGIQRSEQQVFEMIQSEQSSNVFVNSLMKLIFALEACISRLKPLPYSLSLVSVYQKVKD